MEKVDIEKIKENPRNPRKINKEAYEKLVNSIKEFPEMLELRPLVVDNEMIVLGGNMRLKALKELKYTEVPVIRADKLTEEQKKRFVVVDNLPFGEWDYDLLGADYGIGELENWGFDTEKMGISLDIDEKDDKIPEIESEVKTKLGDIYEFRGGHRVLCGDSTKDEDINLLFNDKKAKMIFTSPPYNMGGGMYETYEDNLKREEYIDFNMSIVNKWKQHLKGFVFWNISYNKNARDEFIEILYRIVKETGLKFLELIVWNKKTAMPVISKEAMTRQYEDILVAGDEESIKEDIDMIGLFRNNNQSIFNVKTRKWLRNYWEISPLNSQLDNHKACYPVELPSRGILIMTNEGDIVADPFLGSGTTLIASEKTGRICYGMELDPKYVDVIVKRYMEYTGESEVIKNGKKIVWE